MSGDTPNPPFKIPRIEIAQEDPRQPEVLALIDALDDFSKSLYPAESNHLLDIEALAQLDVIFFVARQEGRAIGCGAFRILDMRHGEIKRMYVPHEARGRGLGWALLDTIERKAKMRGMKRLSLETGIHNHDAVNLYRRAGYAGCPPFGDYKPDPLSLFMTKEIA
jgi:putative acetyltransferase